MGVDLALDGLDVLDSRKIQVAPPDKGYQVLQEHRAGLRITRAGARLDHGGAFPVLAHSLIVIQRRIGGDGDLCGAGIGTQAQIGAKDIAVAGDFAEQFDHAAHDIHRRPAHVAALGKWKFLRVVKHHQIDIAGVIQLMRAVLAHRQHRHAQALLEPCAVALFHAGTHRFLPQQETQRAADAGIGKARQPGGDLAHIPATFDIGQGDGQRGAALCDAQFRHGAAFAISIRHRQSLRDGRVQHGLRAGGEIVSQHRRLAQRQPPQKGAVAEHRVQQRIGAGEALLGQAITNAGGAGGIERLGRNTKHHAL